MIHDIKCYLFPHGPYTFTILFHIFSNKINLNRTNILLLYGTIRLNIVQGRKLFTGIAHGVLHFSNTNFKIEIFDLFKEILYLMIEDYYSKFLELKRRSREGLRIIPILAYKSRHNPILFIQKSKIFNNYCTLVFVFNI